MSPQYLELKFKKKNRFQVKVKNSGVWHISGSKLSTHGEKCVPEMIVCSFFYALAAMWLSPALPACTQKRVPGLLVVGHKCRRGPRSDKLAATTGKSGRQVQVLDEGPHSPPSSISTPSLTDDASGGLGSSVPGVWRKKTHLWQGTLSVPGKRWVTMRV